MRIVRIILLTSFAVVFITTEKARIGWYGWPYCFAAKGEMELLDPWAAPDGTK